MICTVLAATAVISVVAARRSGESADEENVAEGDPHPAEAAAKEETP